MSAKGTVVIMTNIISPYKTLLFNAIYHRCQQVKVIYIAETEKRREWHVAKSEIEFPFETMFSRPVDEVGFPALFRESWKRLDHHDPEVVIIDGYLYAFSWAGLLWAKANRRKVVLWSSSNAVDHQRVFYKELIKSMLIKGCAAFNVYGTKSREYLVKLGADVERILLVGNTTDNDFYHRETARWRADREPLRSSMGAAARNFLYIGRFSEEKNLFTLLDAYRKLSGEGASHWGLILLGNGPQLPQIEEYIAAHGIRNVILPGFKQKDAVCKYLAVSDVLVLPSTSEPWGLVVNEAMAAGLPVVVSRNCGCYPDLVKDNENGFSFDPQDERELSGLLQRFVDDEVDADLLGKNARALIREFTPAKAAAVVHGTIELVVGEARC